MKKCCSVQLSEKETLWTGGADLSHQGSCLTHKPPSPFVSEHRDAYASQQHNKSTWGKSCNGTSIASHPRHLVFAWCRSVADSGVSSCGGLHADIYNDDSIISVSAVLSVLSHTCLSFQTGCQISCWEVQSDSPRKKKKVTVWDPLRFLQRAVTEF